MNFKIATLIFALTMAFQMMVFAQTETPKPQKLNRDKAVKVEASKEAVPQKQAADANKSCCKGEGQTGCKGHTEGKPCCKSGEKKAEGCKGHQEGEKKAEGCQGHTEGKPCCKSGEAKAEGCKGHKDGEKKAEGCKGHQEGEKKAEGCKGEHRGEKKEGCQGHQTGTKKAEGEAKPSKGCCHR